MKGVVFTEFAEMIEAKFGLETLDYILENSELKSGGAYTSVGTYDFVEMVNLITTLSKLVDIPFQDLVYVYSLHFFEYLKKTHPDIFKIYKTAPEFLNAVESHIHVHVRKIYPNAELPHFDVISDKDNCMEMVYTSERGLYIFAKGLMEKTFEYYKENAEIQLHLLNDSGTKVKFVINYGK